MSENWTDDGELWIEKLLDRKLVLVVGFGILLFVVLMLVSSSQGEAAVVGEWHFDEGSDQWANDTSGNDNNGTLGVDENPGPDDPSWTLKGINNSALDFDGIDDYIDCGNDPSLNITNEITVETWIYKDSDFDWGGIAGKWGIAGYRSYLLTISNHLPECPSFYIHDGATEDFIDALSGISNDQWYHIVGVYNGTHISIYIDGVLNNSKITTITSLSTNNQEVEIGKFQGFYFNGTIDEVRIWDRELTASEIQDNYNATAPVHNIDKDTYYTSIQVAIEDADPGDTIEAKDITYDENVNVNKDLTFRSMSSSKVVINGNLVVENGGAFSIVDMRLGVETITVENGGVLRIDPTWVNSTDVVVKGLLEMVDSYWYLQDSDLFINASGVLYANNTLIQFNVTNNNNYLQVNQSGMMYTDAGTKVTINDTAYYYFFAVYGYLNMNNTNVSYAFELHLQFTADANSIVSNSTVYETINAGVYLETAIQVVYNTTISSAGDYGIIVRGVTGSIFVDECNVTGNMDHAVYIGGVVSTGNIYLNNTDLYGYTINGLWVSIDSPNLVLNLDNVDFLPNASSEYGIRMESGGDRQLGGLSLKDVNFVGNSATNHAVYAPSMYQNVRFENVVASGYSRGFDLKRAANILTFNFTNVSLSGVTDGGFTYGFHVDGGTFGEARMKNVTVRDFTGAFTRGIFIQDVDSIPVFDNVLVDNIQGDGVYIWDLDLGSVQPTNLTINNTCNNNNLVYAFYVYNGDNIVLNGSKNIRITNNTGGALYIFNSNRITINNVLFTDNGVNTGSYTMTFRGCFLGITVENCTIKDNLGTCIGFLTGFSQGDFWLKNTDLEGYTQHGIQVSVQCPTLAMNLNNVDFLPQTNSVNGISSSELGGLYLTDVNFVGNGATSNAIYATQMYQDVSYENVISSGYARGFDLRRSANAPNYYFRNVSLSGVSDSNAIYGFYINGSGVGDVQMTNVTVRDFNAAAIDTVGLHIESVASISLFQDILIENMPGDGIWIDFDTASSFAPSNMIINDTCSSDGDYALSIQDSNSVVLDGTTPIKITNNTGSALYLLYCQNIDIDDIIITNNGVSIDSETINIRGCSGFITIDNSIISDNLGTPIYFFSEASSGDFWLNDTDLPNYDSNGVWVALDSPGLAINLNNVDFLPNAGSQYGVRIHNASGVRQLGWLNLSDVNFVGNGATSFAVLSTQIYYGVEFLNVTSDGYAAGFCLGKGSSSPYFYFTNVLLRGVTQSGDLYGLCVFGVFSGDVQMRNVTVRDFAPSAFITIGINLDLVNSVSVFEDVLVENIGGPGIRIQLTDSAPFIPSNLVINNTATSNLEYALRFSGIGIVLDSTVKITNNSGGSTLYISGCPNIDMDGVYIYNNGIDTNSETIVLLGADGIVTIDSCTILDNKGTPIYFSTGASDAKFWLNDTDLEGYETYGIWVGVNCPDLELNLNNVNFIPDSVTVTQYGIYADNDVGWLNLTDVNFIGTNEFPQSVYATSIYLGATFENVTADGYGRGYYLRRGGSGSPNYYFYNVSLAGVSDSGGVTPETNGFFVFGNGAGDVKMSNVTVRDFTSTTARGIFIQQVDSISLFEDILVDNTLADGVYIFSIFGGLFAPENLIINDTCNNDNNQYALYISVINGVTLDGTTTIKITNNTGGALYLSSCQDISINDVTFEGNGFNTVSRTIEFSVCTGFMEIDDCTITNNDGTPISFTTSGSVGGFWLNNTDLINYTLYGIEIATDSQLLDIYLNNVDFIPDAVTATPYGIYADNNLSGLALSEVNFLGTNELYQSVYAFSMFQDVTFENVTADGYGRGYYIKRSSGTPSYHFYNVSLSGVSDSAGPTPSANGFFVFGDGAGDVKMSNVTVRDFTSTTARGIFIQQVDSISLFEDVLVDNTLADGIYIFNIFGSSFAPENLIINDTCSNDNGQSALYVWLSNGVTLDGMTTIKITNNTGTALNFSSCQNIKINDVILENNGFNTESKTINFTSCSGFMAIDDCIVKNNDGTSIYFGIPSSSGGFWLNNTDLVDYTQDGIRVSDQSPSLTMNLNNVDFMPQAGSAYGIYCYDGSDTELGWLYLTDVNFVGNGASAHAVYADKMLQEVRFENVVADGYARGFYFANGSDVTNYYFTNVSLSGVSNGEPEDGLYASGNSSTSEVQMVNVTVKDFSSLSAIGIYLKNLASVSMSQYILVENIQVDGIFLENVENVVIENCTVRDLTSSSTVYAGIHFASPVSDITIRDTTIDDIGRYGIYIQGVMNPGTLTLDHVDILNYSDGSGRGFMSNNHLTNTDVVFSNVTVSQKVGFSPDHGILFWGEVKTLLLDNVTVGNPAQNSQYDGIQVGISMDFGVREWLHALNVEVFGYQRGIVIYGDNGMTPSFDFWEIDIHDIDSGLSDSIGLQIESGTGGWANLTRVNVYDITGPDTGHGIRILSLLQISMDEVWVNNTQGGGIYVRGQGDFSPKSLTITNNGATGLFITGFTTGTIDGTNTISDNMYDGIHIRDADNILIHNATVQRNGQAAGYAGIHFEHVSGIIGNLTLRDLTLEDNGQYGVNIEGTLTAGTFTMERVNIWNYTERGMRGGDLLNTEFMLSNITVSMKSGSGASYGIELNSNVKSIILDNIAVGNPADNATNYGIVVGSTGGTGTIEWAVVKNVEIFGHYFGMLLGSGSENVTFDIKDVMIHNICWPGLNTYGIYIKSDMGGWVNLTNVDIRDIPCSVTSYGMYIEQGQTTSPTVHARDITITNMTDGRGIGISVGNDSLLENVVITDISGANSWGVIVKEAVGGSLTFLDISIDNIHGAFYGDGALDDVWVINGSFTNMNTYNYYLQAANEHVTSLNTTLDTGAANFIGDPSTSNLTIAWYCSLFIVNTMGDMLPVFPANIAFNDTFGANHLTTTNDPNGYLNWTIIKEEVIGLNPAYYSPYNIVVWNATLQTNITAYMNQSRWYVIQLLNIASVNWVFANGVSPYNKPWSLDSFELTANATDPAVNIIEIRYNSTLGPPDQGILMNPIDGSYDDNPWEEANAIINTGDKGIWAVGTSFTFYVWAYNGVEWSSPATIMITVYDDVPPDTTIVQANGTMLSWVKPWSYDWFTLSAYTNDVSSGDQIITAVEYFMDGTGPSGTGTAMLASDGTFDSLDEWAEIIIDTSDKGIWAPGTTHTFFVHGFDGTNWGSYLTVEVVVSDDVPPETQDVTADYQNPLLASYPWDIITIRATINDTLGANQDITVAEYFVDTPGSDGTGNVMVVSDSIWDSPVEEVQTGINVSAWSFGESHTYYIHGMDGSNWGFFLTVTITKPSIDTIDIVTDPGNGVSPIGDMMVPVGFANLGFASAHNGTAGFLGDVVVNWSAEGNTSSFVDLVLSDFSTIYIGLEGGLAYWNASIYYVGEWYNDTVEFTVLIPTIDRIVITDQPGSSGTEIGDRDIPIGYTTQLWAAAYNDTAGIFDNLGATWTITNISGSEATIDSLTGSNTTFYAGIEAGIANITIDDGLGHNDTVELTILLPAIDFLVITDSPNGAALDTVNVDIGGQVTAYASVYNTTGSLYLGVIEVSWMDDPDLGTFDNDTGTNTIFTGGLAGGATTINAENLTLGLNDTFMINIAFPTANYIIITDAPNGAALTTLDIFIGEQMKAYASGYNNTGATYVGLVEFDWTDDPDLGTFDNDTGTNTIFTAGFAGGTVTITGNNTVLDLSDTFTINIADPTVNYITVTDASNGAELITVNIDIGGQVTVYVSGYNSTGSTFVGLVSVDWSGTGGTWSQGTGQEHIFTAGNSGGTYTQTCQNTNLGVSDTFDIDIANPTVDEIRIVDDAGNEIHDISLDPGDSITIYARGYNETTGDIGPIDVDWSASGGATLSTTTGSSTTITAGDDGGSFAVDVDFDDVSASIDLDVSKISEEEPEDGIPIWLLLLVIVIIVILLLIFLMTRRKEAEELPSETVIEEPAEIEHIDIDEVLEILKEEKDWDEEKLEKAKRTMERVNEMGEEK